MCNCYSFLTYLGQEEQQMVLDLPTEDLGGGLVRELDDVRHAVDEHPLLDGVLIDFSSVIFHTRVFELLENL